MQQRFGANRNERGTKIKVKVVLTNLTNKGTQVAELVTAGASKTKKIITKGYHHVGE